MNNHIQQFEQAREQAVAHLEELRQAAHAAASATRDKLQDAVSAKAQRKQLVGIIVAAIDQADAATIAAAPLKVQQLTAGIAHPSVQAGDGNVLLDVFTDAVTRCSYTDTQVRGALLACLLMASGRADAGLFRFAKPFHDWLTLPTLDAFAGIINVAAYQRYQADLAELQHDHAEAARLANLTASPVSITPSLIPAEKAEEPETLAIRYTEESTPLVAAGITLKGYGAINHVTRSEFDKLQGSPLYRAGLEVGSIEVQP